MTRSFGDTSSYPTGKSRRFRQAGQVRNTSIACAKWLLLLLLHHNRAMCRRSALQKEGEGNFTRVGASGITCAYWNYWSGPDCSQLVLSEDRYEFGRKKRKEETKNINTFLHAFGSVKGQPIF